MFDTEISLENLTISNFSNEFPYLSEANKFYRTWMFDWILELSRVENEMFKSLQYSVPERTVHRMREDLRALQSKMVGRGVVLSRRRFPF